MKLKDFLVTEAIVPKLSGSDAASVIRELVLALSATGAVAPEAVEEVVAALIKREQAGTTAFGKGVAVPHVKHPRITKMTGTIGCSLPGIDFHAHDNQPVHTVVLMVSPDREPKHQEAMKAVFFTLLQDDRLRSFLKKAESASAIAEIIDEADAKNV